MNKWHIDEVFAHKPHLQLICAQNVADYEIIGTVISDL